ncbi:MAG: chemotaxis protein CheD [Armatimonadetes bacterium]|nr:chemotaxis protein CheD [Armatimonadota bacterium]
MANQVLVGMADIQILSGEGSLVCLGLGSCIGLLAYDSSAGVAGMAHIMLPESFKDKPIEKLGKFANTGVPELIKQLESAGARTRGLVWAYAGGAQVFKYGAGASSDALDVGRRNAAAVEAELKKLGARVIANDTGGTSGRTLSFFTESSEVKIRTVQNGERVLCRLGDRPTIRKAA